MKSCLGLGALLGCGVVGAKTRVLPCGDMEDKLVKWGHAYNRANGPKRMKYLQLETLACDAS